MLNTRIEAATVGGGFAECMGGEVWVTIGFEWNFLSPGSKQLSRGSLITGPYACLPTEPLATTAMAD